MKKTPTDNGRFYEMAAVAPHKRQCNFGGFAPARASVEAATTPSRWDVSCKRETVGRGQRSRRLNFRINYKSS